MQRRRFTKYPKAEPKPTPHDPAKRLVVELTKGQMGLCGMAAERGRYPLDTACITPEVVCVTDGRTATVATHQPGAKVPSESFMVDGKLFRKAAKLAHKDGPVTIERTPDGTMKVSARKDGVRTTVEEVDEVVGKYPNARSVMGVPVPEGSMGVSVSIGYLKRLVAELHAISANGPSPYNDRVLLVLRKPQKATMIGGVPFSDMPVDLILPPVDVNGTKYIPGAALLMPIDPESGDALALTDNPLKKAPTGCESIAGAPTKKTP